MNVALLICAFIYLSRAYNDIGERAVILDNSYEKDISSLDELIDEIEEGELYHYKGRYLPTTIKPRQPTNKATSNKQRIHVFRNRTLLQKQKEEEDNSNSNEGEDFQSDEAKMEMGWTTINFNDSDADASSDTEIIKKLLGRGYDWKVRPPGINLSIPDTHGPVVVKVNMLLRSISKIDDVNMEYSVQMTFREEWVDGRLAFGLPNDNKPDFIILTAGQQIWMPDSFFQNEKQAQKHMIDKPNVLIRIHKDGKILYSVRISMVLSCPMYLHDYPMDLQVCEIQLASYAYTDKDIEYRWKSEDPKQSVQLKPGLNSSLPSFMLTDVQTGSCASITNTGNYSCLRTTLEFRRQFSYYLLQLYIPSCMLVIVSWVSFWLDRGAVPARVTLGVTTLLTMTTQSSGINAKLPPVSYTKAIDIWIGACLTFIFGALLEFAWVTYISSRSFHRSNKSPKKTRGSLLVTAKQAMVIPNTNAAQLIEASPDLRMRMDTDVWVRQGSERFRGGSYGSCLEEGTSPREIRPLMAGLSPEIKRRPTEEAEMIVLAPIRSRRSSIWSLRLRNNRLYRWISNKFDVDDRGKRADLVSRVLFPFLFVLFNIIYWIRYSSYRVPTI